jgi:hypothetical protein
VDLSTVLGGLAGGAIASPILVGEGLTKNENRVWLGSVALGAVAGTAVGILLTTNETESPMFSVAPYFDVVPTPSAAGSANVEVFGVMGSW